MCPQEQFAYHKRQFWPVLCLKRIGLPCCTFFSVTVTCSLPIILLSNYSLLIISVLADITLLKTVVISFYSSLGSTLLLIEKTTIDPLYLWAISPARITSPSPSPHRHADGTHLLPQHLAGSRGRGTSSS